MTTGIGGKSLPPQSSSRISAENFTKSRSIGPVTAGASTWSLSLVASVHHRYLVSVWSVYVLSQTSGIFSSVSGLGSCALAPTRQAFGVTGSGSRSLEATSQASQAYSAPSARLGVLGSSPADVCRRNSQRCSSKSLEERVSLLCRVSWHNGWSSG